MSLVGMQRSSWFALVAALALTSACSSADATSDLGEAATDGAEGSTGSSATGGADSTSDGPADPGSGDETGLTTGGAGTDGSGGDSEDGLADILCKDVDCSGAGSCQLVDDAPVCVCDAGFASIGTDCVRCEPPKSEAIGLDMAHVELSVTLAQLAPPASALEYGELWLRNRATGDEIALGDTRTPTVTADVLVGSYDLVYQFVAGQVVAPANRRVRVGVLDVDDDVAAVVIDIPVVHLTGSFSFDGVAAPDSATEHGRVYLRGLATGDEILLGDTRYGGFDRRVVPGEYVIFYEAIAGADIAPVNARAQVGELVVPKSESLDVAIDIATVEIGGNFSFDGAPAPSSAAENGVVSLAGPGDDLIVLGETKNGSYQRRVVAGTYDLVYEAKAGFETAPANTRAVFDVLDTSSGSFDVDVETVAIAGAITVNGQPAPADPTDDGRVFLRHASGDEILLGSTSQGSYQRRVIAGYYELYYAQDTSRVDVPRNSNALLGSFDATVGADTPIDIASIAIDGAITLAGDTPPDSEYQNGHVYLRDIETGDSVLLATTRAAAFAAPVVPGAYEIVYVADHAGGPLPANTGAVIGDVVLDDAPVQSFAIDVPVVALAGPVTLDGATPPAAAADLGNLYLVDARTRDQVYLGTTAEGMYSRQITPGDYLLYYRAAASTGLVPQNSNANLGCWQIVE